LLRETAGLLLRLLLLDTAGLLLRPELFCTIVLLVLLLRCTAARELLLRLLRWMVDALLLRLLLLRTA
jgi:hypothetical protein